MFGPANLPSGIATKLSEAAAEIIMTEQMTQRLSALGLDAAPLPASQMDAYIRSELDKWGHLCSRVRHSTELTVRQRRKPYPPGPTLRTGTALMARAQSREHVRPGMSAHRVLTELVPGVNHSPRTNRCCISISAIFAGRSNTGASLSPSCLSRPSARNQSSKPGGLIIQSSRI